MRIIFVRSFQLHQRIQGSVCGKLRPNLRQIKYEFATATATESTAQVLPPQPSGEQKKYDGKILKIVDDISKLTLFEVSELNECLKKTLNIADAPVMAYGSIPVQAQPAAEDEEESTVKTVQTAFTLKLNKFDDSKKVALIKEVKNIVEGLNLVQAKKFVESAPQVLKSNLSKDEAEKLKATIEAAGGFCTIE